MYATANGYVLDLLMGDKRNLEKYVLLLEERLRKRYYQGFSLY